MIAAKALVVFRKELRDTFRDKSTILTVLVLPLVMYPALFIGMGLLIGRQKENEEQRISQVSIIGGPRDSALIAALKADPKIVLADLPDPEKELADGVIQAVVRFGVGPAPGNGRQILTVLYDESSRNSEVARKRLKLGIEAHQQKAVFAQLAGRGIDTLPLRQADVTYQNTASAGKMGGFVMGMIIPYMIILLACMGALHTAMDISAGEKERRTIETLLVSNVSRNQIVGGKLLAVVCMGLLTAFLGLCSLGLTALSGVSIMSAERAAAGISISPGAMALAFLTLLPCSVLVSSLLLLIGSFARSVKEGSAYGSYFLMGVMMLCIGSITPMEPSPRMFAIPVLNTALCQKELLMGIFNWGHLGTTLVTTGLLAVVAVGVTVAMFSQEGVLFRS